MFVSTQTLSRDCASLDLFGLSGAWWSGVSYPHLYPLSRKSPHICGRPKPVTPPARSHGAYISICRTRKPTRDTRDNSNEYRKTLSALGFTVPGIFYVCLGHTQLPGTNPGHPAQFVPKHAGFQWALAENPRQQTIQAMRGGAPKRPWWCAGCRLRSGITRE